MVVNTAGLVLLGDGGVPRIISGVCKETISGGQFVFASGADNVVSSGANSFVGTDIQWATGASGAQVNGVAIMNGTSGTVLGVLTRGTIIATASNTVTAGYPVSVDGQHSVANAGSVAGNLAALRNVGRALTSAASGGHCIVSLNL